MNSNVRNIDIIGLWVLRILLAIGAITLSCLGRYEAASTFGVLCIISFMLFS